MYIFYCLFAPLSLVHPMGVEYHLVSQWNHLTSHYSVIPRPVQPRSGLRPRSSRCSPPSFPPLFMQHDGEGDADEGEEEEWSNVRGVSAIDVLKYEATYEQKVCYSNEREAPVSPNSPTGFSPLSLSAPRSIKLYKHKRYGSSYSDWSALARVSETWNGGLMRVPLVETPGPNYLRLAYPSWYYRFRRSCSRVTHTHVPCPIPYCSPYHRLIVWMK